MKDKTPQESISNAHSKARDAKGSIPLPDEYNKAMDKGSNMALASEQSEWVHSFHRNASGFILKIINKSVCGIGEGVIGDKHTVEHGS